MRAHRELLYLQMTYPESHDPLNVGWAGGWRLHKQKGRQYTLSFNSMHRITWGPSGEVSDASALNQSKLPPVHTSRSAAESPGLG